MTKSKIARLNRETLEDARLGATDLAFLFYILESEEFDPNNFLVEEIADRFQRGRDWFRRYFNKLIRLGYAKRDDSKHDPLTGHPITLYAVTDMRGALDDPRIEPDLFENTEVKLKRIYKTDPRFTEDQFIQSRPQQNNFPPMPEYNDFYEPQYETAHHTKGMNHATMSQADLELTNFFAKYGFAMPKTPKEWEEARKPGIKAWAKVTETPLDWQAARLLNKRIIEPINMAALEIAWERWTSTSYRKERAIGVIEWYEELCKDMNATPWNRGQTQSQYRRKSNAPKRPVQSSDGQHGRSTTKYKEEDFKVL